MFILFFSMVLVIGVYLMYQEAFVDVPRTSINAVAKTKNFSLTRQYNSSIDKLSTKVTKYVSLSEEKEATYKKILLALDIGYNPQQYMARLITKCLMYFLLGLLAYSLTPIVTVMLWTLSFYVYYSDFHKIKVSYQKRVDEIELELPKLCSVINSRIKSTSNTIQILQSFQPIAGKAMGAELAITINDMKTGSHETALRRFEQRLNSAKVSAVVRGLISVENGDDQSVYFQAKQHQFNNDYFTIRKKEISKRSLKLTMPGIVAFIFFLMIIIYPISEVLSQTNIF